MDQIKMPPNLRRSRQFEHADIENVEVHTASKLWHFQLILTRFYQLTHINYWQNWQRQLFSTIARTEISVSSREIVIDEQNLMIIINMRWHFLNFVILHFQVFLRNIILNCRKKKFSWWLKIIHEWTFCWKYFPIFRRKIRRFWFRKIKNYSSGWSTINRLTGGCSCRKVAARLAAQTAEQAQVSELKNNAQRNVKVKY